jgi:hypothetical protein
VRWSAPGPRVLRGCQRDPSAHRWHRSCGPGPWRAPASGRTVWAADPPPAHHRADIHPQSRGPRLGGGKFSLPPVPSGSCAGPPTGSFLMKRESDRDAGLAQPRRHCHPARA